ncbi:anthranilate synthase component I [Janibacter hoylei]|uniref:anthranilate synthase component I n=1 Tax=Janibacter hoylei TaxID=364298 RepID=UPI0021A639A5|nr:anthranilate synthase component I [Janibacter hoylei]MCT1617760.1 anthranilate synthase component I [Janibacter hoylei]MCT2292429.1 anthranilate synthase component I [Janibacter hoylei]MCW4600589.1 anthranilate synthase component I [Janibacter hoylei]
MTAPGAEVPDLTPGRTWPELDTFTVLARDRRVVPVVRRLVADGETPVGVYRKLAGDAPGTFLLESAEHGGVWSRWSIIGAQSRATLTERDGQAHWIGEPPSGVPTDGDPTAALRATLEALSTDPIEGLPPLTGGMVGAITYDAVRRWEKVPAELPDVLGVPELGMVLATDVAVLDHSDGTLLLVANAINYDATDERVEEAWRDAVERLDAMTERLAAPAPSTVATVDPEVAEAARGDVTSDVTVERFEEIVELAKEDIRAGEVFQVVLSQRFSTPCPVDALEVYRALRRSNPSPYMYFVRLPHPDGSVYEVVGSSPEALVKVTGRRAITHPIAGTRPRGKTPEHDLALEEDLLADPKERSEHVMLVDLGRNDLQRVCDAGTVDCVEFMNLRRYSHVIHLESTVVGEMAKGVNAFDVLVATFPAGTLSGAPKPRALELVERYERSRRGVYGGVVGYLDFHGDMDMAIAIRTALVKDGVAHVQAGAGIVADSVPSLEQEETVHKAGAALAAVAAARALRPAGGPS